MGHCAGIRNGVKERISPSDVDFRHRGLEDLHCVTVHSSCSRRHNQYGYIMHPYLYGKHYNLMCFLGRLVAKLGSDFLLVVLMEVPDGMERHMVVVGVGCAGFVAQTEAVPDLSTLKGSGVFCSARRTRLHVATRRAPCGHVQMEAMRSGMRFIVAPTGGLRDIVEHGLIDLWTGGTSKVTVEAFVEQGFRKSEPCQEQ
eukprot:s8233_g2.t1